MSRIAHIRMYPSDWRSGCLGLSLEQEGLYIRMCMFMAETGRRVPLDDTESARMLNVQTRNYRRVLGELLRLGKIKRHEDGYGNDRVETEREEAEKALDRKSAPAAGERPDREANQGPERQDFEATADLSPNYSRYNGVTSDLAGEKGQQKQALSIEPESEPLEDVADVARARAIDFETMCKRLNEAAAPAIANPAAYPGLLNFSTPSWWLEQGCDLDRDVLPAVAEVARKRAGKQKITTWDYFTAAVANAKAKREGRLPEAQIQMAAAVTPKRRTVSQILREEAAAHG